MKDAEYLDNFQWKPIDGIPANVESCFQRPVSRGGERSPMDRGANFFLQSMGHWIWAF